jgi:hypothetical protein
MWILQLNPMTANAERVVPVVRAETREALEMFMAGEIVGPYQDGQWHKCFKQGGRLEWFNPPLGGEAWIGVPAFVDIGTEQDWMSRAADDFHQLEIEIPSI